MDADEIREEGFAGEVSEDRVEADHENENEGVVAEDGTVVVANLVKQFERGANWFYWIAGLSVVNSVVALSGVGWAFVIGLGITQVVDAMVVLEEASVEGRIIAFCFDVMIASIVALFGYLCRKRLRWVFIVGMILYGIDGLLLLIATDVFGAVFHAFALFGIFGGFKACGQLNAMERELAGAGHIDSDVRQVVWPGVVGILSFAYIAFYAMMSVRNWPNYARLTACALLLGGVIGIYLKRKASVFLIISGAGVVIFYSLYSFAKGILTSPEPVHPVAVIVLFAILGFILIWPVFLIVWFMLSPVRAHVDAEWD